MRNATFQRIQPIRWAKRGLSTATLLIAAGGAMAGIWDEGDVENGQVLFNANCATCHKVTNEVLAAPGLAGIADRWGASDALLLQWIQSPVGAAESGDPYIKSIVERYVPTFGWMSDQAVSEEDVRDIMSYIKNPPFQAAGPETDTDCVTIDDIPVERERDSTGLWFLLLLTLFTIVTLSAAGVNRTLTNALREKDGEPLLEELNYSQRIAQWMWSHRVFVGLLTVFIVAYGVVIGYQALMGIGVVDGYKPSQPVHFIHSVHVCENEIDCQYCHHSADKSKHAGIPSANVCMNCHKAVKEGRRYGETEIAKIYEAIGFDPETGSYIDGAGESGHYSPQESFDGDPIKWNKVHNLPDHVFFSHQQHVEVGGLQCQNCHGDVETYTVGRVAHVEDINVLRDKFPGIIELSKPTLTMGWCIECHNKAEVGLESNGYYEEMHERLLDDERGNEELRKWMEDDKITVKELGGWECSKCHY